MADNAGMQAKWWDFLKRLSNPEISFQNVIDKLEIFLEPVWKALITESEWLHNWNLEIKEGLYYG